MMKWRKEKIEENQHDAHRRTYWCSKRNSFKPRNGFDDTVIILVKKKKDSNAFGIRSFQCDSIFWTVCLKQTKTERFCVHIGCECRHKIDSLTIALSLHILVEHTLSHCLLFFSSRNDCLGIHTLFDMLKLSEHFVSVHFWWQPLKIIHFSLHLFASTVAFICTSSKRIEIFGANVNIQYWFCPFAFSKSRLEAVWLILDAQRLGKFEICNLIDWLLWICTTGSHPMNFSQQPQINPFVM